MSFTKIRPAFYLCSLIILLVSFPKPSHQGFYSLIDLVFNGFTSSYCDRVGTAGVLDVSLQFLQNFVFPGTITSLTTLVFEIKQTPDNIQTGFFSRITGLSIDATNPLKIPFDQTARICIYGASYDLIVNFYLQSAVGLQLVATKTFPLTSLVSSSNNSGLYYLDGNANVSAAAQINFQFRNFSSYDNLIGSLNTGDIVLFSGNTPSGSIIEVFTKSEFSHVAVLLKNDDGEIVTLEATTNIANLESLLNNKTGAGVRQFNFHDKVFAGTYSVVAVRKALFNVTELQRETLRNFGVATENATYDSNPEDLIQPACASYGGQVAALIPLCNTQQGNQDYEDMGSFFCSEFVAKALINMSLLNTTINPIDYAPVSFSSFTTIPLPLETTVGYAPEIYIFVNLPTASPLLTFLVGVWYFVFAISLLSVIVGVGYAILSVARGLVSSKAQEPVEEVKSDTILESKKDTKKDTKSDTKSDSKSDTKSDSKNNLTPTSVKDKSAAAPTSKRKTVDQDVELGFVPVDKKSDPNRKSKNEPPASVPNVQVGNSFSSAKRSEPPKSVQF